MNPFEARARGLTGRGPTDIERIMARALTDAKVKFREQEPIGPYFADFYLPDNRTIVEVDGEFWHKRRKARDDRRDIYMRSCGFQVIRFKGEIVKSRAADCVRIAIRPPYVRVS